MANGLDRKSSLMERQRVKFLVPIALLACTVLFLLALSLPLLHTQQQLLWRRWENSYSAWTGVVALWHQHEYSLAAVLFIFCIVFPLVKLLALALIWGVRLWDHQRAAFLHWLGVMGKWSMLDVFGVAIIIVLVKFGPLVQVEPRSGVYVFAAAILMSMLLTMYIDRLARRAGRP